LVEEVEVLNRVVHVLVVQGEVVELLVSTLLVVLEEEGEVVPLKEEGEVLEELVVVVVEPPWMAVRAFHQTEMRKDSSWKLFSVGLSPPPAL
jgi:hypothetical protein